MVAGRHRLVLYSHNNKLEDDIKKVPIKSQIVANCNFKEKNSLSQRFAIFDNTDPHSVKSLIFSAHETTCSEWVTICFLLTAS